MQSRNDVALTASVSNNLRGDTIRLVFMYIFYEANDEILETIVAKEELNHDEFILGVEVESSDYEIECNENIFSQ